MRKLALVVLSALIVLGFSSAWAEQSAFTQSGRYNRDQGMYVDMYNNSGVKLTANLIVIHDTGGVLTPSSVGSYFSRATTSDSVYVLGVLDQDVLSASVGRVCIRGPHQVQMATEAGVAIGNLIGTANTVTRNAGEIGNGQPYTTADGTAGGRLGVAIGEQQATPTSVWWVWVNPRVHQ